MIKKIIGVLLAFGLLGFIIFALFVQEKEHSKIISYEDCASSGYPILESYPERCVADGKIFVRNIGNELEKTNLIILDTPKAGSKIFFPLALSGQARGNWFFEASFPAEILDGDGKLLGVGIMTAVGDWMTVEFVPFAGMIELVEKPRFLYGTLILRKDNPSGETQFDDSLIVPIIFGD